MKLHQYLGRRLGLATASVLLLFLVLAVSQAVLSINRERSAVVHLLELSAQIEALQSMNGSDFEGRLADIIHLSREGDFRHVEIRITDREGTLIAQSDPLHDANPAGLWVGKWMHTLGSQAPDSTFTRMWHIGHVIIAIRPSLASEQSEAGTNLLFSLAMLICFSAVLFVGMRWVLSRALHPLGDSITQLQNLARNEYGGKLSSSQVDELQRINQAINDLSHSLAALESSRQMLSAKLISSQEDERAHISRDLHDELGQKLTVIRLNTSYLQRVLSGQPHAQQALSDVMQAIKDIDGDLRSLLLRLRSDHDQGHWNNQTLQSLLGQLINQWEQLPGQSTAFEYQVQLGPDQLGGAIVLTLFRITQEALTNIAKHAKASQVCICIQRHDEHIQWDVSDNGIGLGKDLRDAMLQGNGLSGLQQRVWALGGEFTVLACSEDSSREQTGLHLKARLPINAGT